MHRTCMQVCMGFFWIRLIKFFGRLSSEFFLLEFKSSRQWQWTLNCCAHLTASSPILQLHHYMHAYVHVWKRVQKLHLLWRQDEKGKNKWKLALNLFQDIFSICMHNFFSLTSPLIISIQSIICFLLRFVYHIPYTGPHYIGIVYTEAIWLLREMKDSSECSIRKSLTIGT